MNASVNSDFSLIYCTCSDTAEARKIAETLIAERLIACANIIPGMESLYRWNGKIESSSEAILLLKTKVALEKDVFARVKALHSYAVPCLFVINTRECEPAYLGWMLGELTPSIRHIGENES